jgi:hypothetical protein
VVIRRVLFRYHLSLSLSLSLSPCADTNTIFRAV